MLCATPLVKTGTEFYHRSFRCKVLKIAPKGVVLKRVNSGLVLQVPYGQFPVKPRIAVA